MRFNKTFPRYQKSRIKSVPILTKRKLWFRALVSPCQRFSQNSKRIENGSVSLNNIYKEPGGSNIIQEEKLVCDIKSEMPHKFLDSEDISTLLPVNRNSIISEDDDKHSNSNKNKRNLKDANIQSQCSSSSKLNKQKQKSSIMKSDKSNRKKLKKNKVISDFLNKNKESLNGCIEYNENFIKVVQCNNTTDLKCPLNFSSSESNSSDNESSPFSNNSKSFKINKLTTKIDECEENEVNSYYTISDESYHSDDEINTYDDDLRKSKKVKTMTEDLKLRKKDNIMSFHIKRTNQIILVLHHPAEIVLKGILEVQSLKDSVTIFGYKLDSTKSPICVYSSKIFKFFSMCTNHPMSNSDWETDLVKKLEEIQTDLFAIMKPSLSEDSIVVLLSPKELKQIEYTKLLGIQNFPSVSESYVQDRPKICKFKINNYHHHLSKIIDNAMNLSGNEINKAPKILICGGKNSGKSTMLRYLINNALNNCSKCFHLEGDVGQTEFTPPGCIALTCVNSPIFGPPFTHLKTPEMTHFIGGVTVNIPDDYISAFSNFYKNYEELFSEYPLFINTMGWTKDVGIALLIDIIHITQPTHIIQLYLENTQLNYPTLTADYVFKTDGWKFTKSVKSSLNYLLIEIPSPSSAKQNVIAPKYRSLAMLSYLGQLQMNFTMEIEPINSFRPYVISWSAISLYVCDDYAPKNHILYAFNGSWVALCTVTDPEFYETEFSFKILKQANNNICHGFGIVRGIDPKKKLFYIITPEPIESLYTVNALLKGHINLPEKLFKSQNGNNIPYMNQDIEIDV
ncbi:polynucleotide 5'-hydroxyl-kinase NOL9 [Centruroides vittatus]|uniref:polynucleotide 5'-hydroxyl-kinase NOL9 n=1 Tax=Centruroides vittatus TaxID=120091 RepID=UPI00350FE7EC